MFTDQTKKISKSRKSTFRRVIEWLHLWLGLISGIILFVVCLTGAIWVWRHEVWYFTEQYQRVTIQEKPFLAPSVLIAGSGNYLRAKEHGEVILDGITYGRAGRSVMCSYNLSGEKSAAIYLNPYTAEIIKDKRESTAAEIFFIFIRAGHRFFWLPRNIGSPVVGSACIVFLIILLTGLIWWYPKKWNDKTREKSFRIKWGAKWKRLNIDLHNVLGFYSFIFVILLTVTGIVFTFEWFEKGIYRSLTWKEKTTHEKPPLSDTTITKIKYQQPVDLLWSRMNNLYGREKIGNLWISVPGKAKEPYRVSVNFGDGTILYNSRIHYYDGKTLKKLRWKGNKAVDYEQLSVGEKVFRMNFDIHTGQILGLPTKILAFITCLVGASLPVTGVIIWYNRKWGKRKKRD
ncbi:putative iron-regulated membrane protein [Pedobacter psychrotolerans]|uniref:Putative iron-regulated membrane protein n=1 Tax=Pedobacter psychrotolerans TaxID=1843235 RepID=A0A4R2H6J9_9SPHI|nr:PepSY-associated TM helix domain-containing protein [Pedobacter psychrotolerans]TCO21483.1 putative iron-regulated membrane protein [Pedobacter psychrotolerans]GGE38988.1 sulfite reductase [Pedobacter psychrotolerans]